MPTVSAAKEFKKRFQTKNLVGIYSEKIHHSQATGIDRIRPASLEKTLASEVALIRKKIFAGTYRFTHYKQKLISKGAASLPRVVSIPTARDRLVLRSLCELLKEVFPGSTPEIPQIKIEALKSALTSGKYQEYVRLDLKRFYDSIKHAELLKALKKKIKKKELLSLVESAIKTPTVPEGRASKNAQLNSEGVPQGLSVSNLLAEITLSGVDSKLKTDESIKYFRYVDDILILTPTGKSMAVSANAIATLKSIGLEPHDPDVSGSKSKLGSLDDSFTFLGYEVEGSKVSVKLESIQKLESSLASIFTAYRHSLAMATSVADKSNAVALCEWRLNLRISGCIFEGKRRGWMFYFSQITDSSPLRAIQNTVNTLIDRFNLKGQIKAKSLLKVHYECKRKDKAKHRYIPNFDTMTVAEKRVVLSLFMGAGRVASISDARVNELFAMRIRHAIKELEADLSGNS